MIEVHHFKYFDIKVGDYVYPQAKRTAEDIRRIAGAEIIPNTAESVEPSKLSADGSFRRS